MKKFFSCAAIVAAMFALTACGGGNGKKDLKDIVQDATSEIKKAKSLEEVANITKKMNDDIDEMTEGMTEAEKATSLSKIVKDLEKAKEAAEEVTKKLSE